MKKTIKVGFILLIVGVILAFVGWMVGGEKPTVITKRFKPMLVDSVKTSKRVSKFININIDVNDGNITLKKGNKFGVKYIGNGRNTPSIKVVNDKLSVTGSNENNGIIFSWGNVSEYKDPEIEITVPKKHKLSNIKFSSGIGDVSVSDIQIDKLTLDQSNGDTNLSNNKLKELYIKNDNGDVNVDKVNLDSGKIVLSDGDFTMNGGRLMSKLSIHNEDGDNLIKGVKAKSYFLSSNDGDNTINNVTSENTMDIHKGKLPHITLVNEDGDNTIKN